MNTPDIRLPPQDAAGLVPPPPWAMVPVGGFDVSEASLPEMWAPTMPKPLPTAGIRHIVNKDGLIGGSVAWTLANGGSYNPALGASGAAFGILGAYLCGWPDDEVYFPLILIRKWPVQFIAMFYFGFEIFKAWQVYGLSEVSHVAHIAHFGGFILAYATLPILKKGIEWEGEVDLVDMSQENPFEGVDELVKKLHEEGDEKETRQAWLEEISERAKCPVCGDNLHLKKMKIKCNSDSSHVSWP